MAIDIVEIILLYVVHIFCVLGGMKFIRKIVFDNRFY